MVTLSSASPNLASQVEAALLADGHTDLAEQIRTLQIRRLTFGDDLDVGYIYFDRLPFPVPPVHNEAALVARTLSFGPPYDFNVDVDHEGNAFGIEYVGREDIGVELRRHGAV